MSSRKADSPTVRTFPPLSEQLERRARQIAKEGGEDGIPAERAAVVDRLRRAAAEARERGL